MDTPLLEVLREDMAGGREDSLQWGGERLGLAGGVVASRGCVVVRVRGRVSTAVCVKVAGD
jgi:hypothetical protein